MDGWNTIGFFWAPALFSGAFAVHFAGEGIIPKVYIPTRCHLSHILDEMSLRLHNSNAHFGLNLVVSEFAVILDVVVFQGTEITDEDLVGEALGLEAVGFYKKMGKE